VGGGATPRPGRPPSADPHDPDVDVPDELIGALGKSGADKIVLISAPIARKGAPMVWSSIGSALAATCDEPRPGVLVCPATGAAADVAPRLAARLGAAFAAHCVVETGPRGEIVFSRRVYGGGFRRRLALDDLDRAAVVTVALGHAPAHGGDA